jgi:hypothetical protein
MALLNVYLHPDLYLFFGYFPEGKTAQHELQYRPGNALLTVRCLLLNLHLALLLSCNCASSQHFLCLLLLRIVCSPAMMSGRSA